MSTKSAQLLDYIDQHERARTDEMAEAHDLPTNTVSALLARYVLDGTLVSCRVERPGLPPVNEYRRSVAGGGRTTEFRDMCGRRDVPAANVRTRLAEHLDSPDAAPQPSTAGPLAAPSKEGVGQGDAAVAAFDALDIDAIHRRKAEPKNGSAVLDDAFIAQSMARPEQDRTQPELPVQPKIGPIEKGVPVPPLTGELRQAVAELKLWQSRLFTAYNAKNIYAAASRARIGIRLVVTPEGIRVWRIR